MKEINLENITVVIQDVAHIANNKKTKDGHVFVGCSAYTDIMTCRITPLDPRVESILKIEEMATSDMYEMNQFFNEGTKIEIMVLSGSHKIRRNGGRK